MIFEIIKNNYKYRVAFYIIIHYNEERYTVSERMSMEKKADIEARVISYITGKISLYAENEQKGGEFVLSGEYKFNKRL